MKRISFITMKGLLCIVAAMLLLLPCVVQADLVLDGFDADPGLIITGPSDGILTGSLPVPVIGGSWTMQTSLSITEWHHYAHLRLGVEGIGSVGGVPNGWDQFCGGTSDQWGCRAGVTQERVQTAGYG